MEKEKRKREKRTDIEKHSKLICTITLKNKKGKTLLEKQRKETGRLLNINQVDELVLQLKIFHNTFKQRTKERV